MQLAAIPCGGSCSGTCAACHPMYKNNGALPLAATIYQRPKLGIYDARKLFWHPQGEGVRTSGDWRRRAAASEIAMEAVPVERGRRRDACGERDARVLRGDAAVVAGRRERAASRSRVAVQAALEKLKPVQTPAPIAAEALRKERARR